MRIMFRSLLFLLALTALGAAVVYSTVHGSLPPLDGKRVVAGPTSEVAIERDALGVVTIIGRSRTDVAFATGFAHAQDRFFQMDLGRRMAAGRLSELFGDAAFDTDVRNRRHRFAVVAAEVRLPRARRASGSRSLCNRSERRSRIPASPPVRVSVAAAGT